MVHFVVIAEAKLGVKTYHGPTNEGALELRWDWYACTQEPGREAVLGLRCTRPSAGRKLSDPARAPPWPARGQRGGACTAVRAQTRGGQGAP